MTNNSTACPACHRALKLGSLALSLALAAFAGLSSIGLGRLLESGRQQWGVGPALRLPIFDGGRLRARTAELDAAIESYNAAVLDAAPTPTAGR